MSFSFLFFFVRFCWRKMGQPLLTEKIVNTIWMTVTWAVYDGDVFFYVGSSFHLGVESDCMVEKSIFVGAWRGTRTMSRDGSTELGSTTGVQWDIPMARWARREKIGENPLREHNKGHCPAGYSSMDSGMGGCGMLIANVQLWMEKRVTSQPIDN